MSEAPTPGGVLYRPTLVPRVPPCASARRGDAPLRVLLVDDVPAARAFLADRLVRRGMEVVGPATSGAQAATLVRILRPDVCLVDVAGPSGVGLPALREVVAADAALEVVACASAGAGRVAVEAVRCGARRVVSTLRELDAVLADHGRGAGTATSAAGPDVAAHDDDEAWVGFGGVAEQRRAPPIDPTATADTVAVRRLRRALDEDGFAVFAEPVPDPATGAVSEHAIVLRLAVADGGCVDVEALMPLAHRFGLGTDIDRWTVREAARWAARGHAVRVDVADESVADPGFPAAVESALADAGAPPSCLVLRVDASTFAAGAPPVVALARRLGGLGCGVVSRDGSRSGPAAVPRDRIGTALDDSRHGDAAPTAVAGAPPRTFVAV